MMSGSTESPVLSGQTKAQMLGALLIKARESAGLRQIEAARALGEQRQYIWKLEHGWFDQPHAEILVRLAKLYGVPPSQWFTAIGYTELAAMALAAEAIQLSDRQVRARPHLKQRGR